MADATPKEILATYPDGSAAVVLRRTGGDYSLFVGTPGLTSELLRLAARRADVDLVTQTDCNVYANGPFVAIHASQDGTIEVVASSPGAIRDLLTGKSIRQGPKIVWPLKTGETRVLCTGGNWTILDNETKASLENLLSLIERGKVFVFE